MSPTLKSERSGAERNPQKTEVIYFVNDLDAAPPEWRIGDVHNIARVSRATAGSVISSWPRQTSSGRCTKVSISSGPQSDFALFRESLGVSRINHILRVHGHTILHTKDSSVRSTFSAGQSGIGDKKRPLHIAAPAHAGRLGEHLRSAFLFEDSAASTALPAGNSLTSRARSL